MNYMQASRSIDYVHPEQLVVNTMGSVQTLPTGDIFVGWGLKPYFSGFTAASHLTLDANLPDGGQSYRAFWLPWVGKPDDAPAIAAESNSATGPPRSTRAGTARPRSRTGGFSRGRPRRGADRDPCRAGVEIRDGAPRSRAGRASPRGRGAQRRRARARNLRSPRWSPDVPHGGSRGRGGAGRRARGLGVGRDEPDRDRTEPQPGGRGRCSRFPRARRCTS